MDRWRNVNEIRKAQNGRAKVEEGTVESGGGGRQGGLVSGFPTLTN